ncbi:MAG: AraC family transcriptional regulator [Cyanobacteriota bacterium]|nr:AraC family transcriptional regulator [Cyanobacteriota bacterium]
MPRSLLPLMEGALLNPGLLALPLLSHSWLRQSCQDPQAWAESVAAVAPVRICEPLFPTLAFRSETALITLGEMTVLATQGSAITVTTDDQPCAQLMLPYRGWGVFQIERQRFENPVGDSVLFVPPAPMSLENNITAGVALTMNPSILVQTALTMAGPEGLPPNRLTVFQDPKLLRLHDPVAAPLINGIYALLLSIHQLATLPGTDLIHLRLDDAILRMIVLLLLPELQRVDPLPHTGVGSVSAKAKLEALADWIETNLESSISLSDMEARVHWSRRTLQYAFREAHGCSPMQWVRRRRLHRAMQRLVHPQPGDTVVSIGRSFGFASAGAFSREFRRQYDCTPSSLFRG